VVKVHFHWK
jgi:dihydroneopterin aldolase